MRVVTGERWTGSPNKSIDKIGKSCQKKKSENRVFQLDNFWTIFGQFLRTFFGHFVDILSTFPFLGLSNDLPVTI